MQSCHPIRSREPLSANRRNWALRLAFVVTAGLVFETLRAAPLPPVAPVIALQILAAVPAPPKPSQAATLFLIACGAAGLAYFLSVATVGNLYLYGTGVGLLYLWGFVFALQKRTALVGIMVLTMTVIFASLAKSSTDAATAMLLSLLPALVGSFVLVYLAQALFPHKRERADGKLESDSEAGKPGKDGKGALPVALQALLASIVMLPAHLYLTYDGAVAMIVLLTMATLLRQSGLADAGRYGITSLAGNALGASLAALAALLLSLHGQIPVFASVTATGALVLSCLIARGGIWNAIVLPGYVAFTMLFGLVLSPLPLADGVDTVGRALLIVGACAYVLACVVLLVPLLPYIARAAGSSAIRRISP